MFTTHDPMLYAICMFILIKTCDYCVLLLRTQDHFPWYTEVVVATAAAIKSGIGSFAFWFDRS